MAQKRMRQKNMAQLQVGMAEEKAGVAVAPDEHQMRKGNLNIKPPHGARRSITYLAGGVTEIAVECELYDIEVASADVKDITILWDEADSWSVLPDYTEGVIRLEERNGFVLQGMADVFAEKENKTLRIVLPKEYAGGLVLSTLHGTIEMLDVDAGGSIAAKSAKGEITARGIATQGAFSADCSEGAVWLQNAKIDGTVKLQSLVGGIRAEGVRCEGDFIAVGIKGMCNFCNVKVAGRFSVSSDSGKMELDTVHADKIDIASTVSPVNTRSLRANTLVAIHTVTGNITCQVDDTMESYVCHCFSNRGQCNMPYHAGEGRKALHVDSDQGSVYVRFERDNKKSAAVAAQEKANGKAELEYVYG